MIIAKFPNLEALYVSAYHGYVETVLMIWLDFGAKNTFWFEITVLVITNMAGDVLRSCQKCHFHVDTNTAAVTTAGKKT